MTDNRWLDDARDSTEQELRWALDEAAMRVDEVALRRVWTHVCQPEFERSRRWPWLFGGLTTAVLAAAIALIVAWPSTTGEERAQNGSGDAAAAGQPSLAAAPTGSRSPATGATSDPATVVAPATVRTGSGERLRVTLRGGVRVELGGSSILEIPSDDRPALERGDVRFDVPRRAADRPLVVQLGAYRVVVVGTKFRLHASGGGVAVGVEEGVVEVWRGHRVARLGRGDSWSSATTANAREPVRARPAPAAREPERPAPSAATLASSAPRQERPAPLAPVLAAPLAAPEPRGNLFPAPAVQTAPSVAPPVPADLATEARSALADGEPQRALTLYRQLAQRGGPAGENAEYEIGRILRDRLGQPAEAVGTWRRYRAEHPDGLLRTEADVSIIETLVKMGDGAAALAEAREFLRKHPGSERSAEIARVAGDLYRASGDCAQAIAAYEIALASPGSRAVNEYVTFHRAACLTKLRDGAGSEALAAYLRNWPNGRFRVEASQLLAASRARASVSGAPPTSREQ